jgi:Rps23 Pro-64 3,4-dihydroxylase Tpa1-like proline 4-hydroxylase
MAQPLVLLGVCLLTAAWRPPTRARRQFVAGTAGALGAEAAWAQAVAAAAAAGVSLPQDVGLPPTAIEEIEGGRVVVVKNWLPADEVAILRADAQESFVAGHFKADALATYRTSQKRGTRDGFDPSNDRMVMPSFYPSRGLDGPWVDGTIGNAAARRSFKRRMASVKLALSRELEGRASLAADGAQTHEMSYTRYGPGAFLARHTDEHHGVLKKGGRPKPTRRSVSWLVYLNEEWDAPTNGGELRVHERIAPSAAPVGARGADLQIGWLKATRALPEMPVFLAANRRGTGDATCMLYTCDGVDGSVRDLCDAPFDPNPVLFLSGGDGLVRKLLIARSDDAARFHLVDAPKSAASAFLPPPGDAGEDGGERVRDVSPDGGTLVLFDSVSLPHQVMPSRGRERFAASGWFHEELVV